MSRDLLSLCKFLARGINPTLVTLASLATLVVEGPKATDNLTEWGFVDRAISVLFNLQHIVIEHWIFVILLLVGWSGFIYLLITKPKKQLKSEFQKRRTVAKSKNSRRHP